MKNLTYILIALGISACREQPAETVRQKERVRVCFAATLPEPVPVRTRATSDTDVDNIDLLVFDHNGLFIERIAATDIAGAGSEKTFAARLEVSNNARTVCVVANGRRSDTNADRVNFSSITAGMSHSTAIPGLQTIPELTPATVGDIFPLTMWGCVTVSAITSRLVINDLKLLRAQACVRAGVLAPDAANGLDRFVFTAFSIAGAAVCGKAAPAAYNSPATIPSTPNASGVTFFNYCIDGNSGHWAPASSPTLYMYERGNSASDYMSLVVRGTYDGQDGYYRVAMVDGNGKPLDIVRNHRYNVTIVGAGGAGSPTVAGALAGAPSNALKVSIVDSRDDIALIVADGQHELGVSNNRAVIRGTATGSALEIATVYATRGGSLAVSSACPAISGVTLTAPDGNGLRSVAARCGGTAGAGTVTVTDGSLKQVIDVEVKNFADGMTVVDSVLYIADPALLTAADRPWYVEIMPGSKYVWLHSSAAATDYPGGDADWGVKFMSSAVFATANLYIHRTLAARGTLKYTYMNGSSQTVARMIFNR